MNIEEIKTKIQKLEAAINNPATAEIFKPKMQESVANLKADLAKLESGAEKKVDVAEKKVEEAETPKEKKEAKAELKEAKEEVKEVEKAVEKAEKVAEKVEKKLAEPKKVPMGRKPMPMKPMSRKPMPMKKEEVAVRRKKASARTKMVKPAVAMRKVEKPVDRTPVKAEKEKTVRAFGQTVKYKNDSEFCKKLISAFKKRKAASKKTGKRRKTKPVFGVIVQSTKNAVSKALHSVSESKIERNPKEFLAKAQRLEKSAIRFLEDFKAILGSDYKKSEITSEFGELEKSIKKFVSKFTK